MADCARPGVVVPAAFAGTILLLLRAAGTARDLALPLLAPLALLGSLEVDSLKRGHSAALDWFGILTFGLARAGLGASGSTPISTASRRASPACSTTPRRATASLPAARDARGCSSRPLWIRWCVRRGESAVERSSTGRWGDAGLGPHLHAVAALRRRAPHLSGVGESLGVHRPADGCIARRDVGLAQRALFYYFAGVVTVPEILRRRRRAARRCWCSTAECLTASRSSPAARSRGKGPAAATDSERYVLYRKNPT